MTEKLFYSDVRENEFEAVVIKCEKAKEHYEIVLDKTCFYPEGGGQPADNGFIDDTEVFDVHDKDGDVIHYTKDAVAVGKTIIGRVDMQRRHSLMQQHSGEHIVSGLIHKKFGYDNVGFHMGSDCITIDFNGTLTDGELKEIEKEANDAIYRDFETVIFYPSAETLKTLPYRSKKELEGDVRIVRFEGCDTCACCGLHVVRTGEIGIIKIVGFQKYKGGTRVYMLAGIRAYEDYAAKNDIVHEISVLLSAKQYDVGNAVKKLYDERNDIKAQLIAAKNKMFLMKRDMIQEGTGTAVLFEDGMEPFELRMFVEMLLEKVPSAAVLCGSDDNGYKYAVGSNTVDVAGFIKEANKELNGRGGGRGNIVQGSFAAKAKEIEEYIKNGMD